MTEAEGTRGREGEEGREGEGGEQAERRGYWKGDGVLRIYSFCIPNARNYVS